jgi:hypothetical protein
MPVGLVDWIRDWLFRWRQKDTRERVAGGGMHACMYVNIHTRKKYTYIYIHIKIRTVVPPAEHGEEERDANGAREVDDEVEDEEDAPVPAL